MSSSRNLRIVEFDVASGVSTKQFIYQTESLADINARVPDDPFGDNSQGRNIGISAIIALNDKEFLIIERDNRGAGVDDPTGAAPVARKRIYKISIEGATHISALDLTGSNDLPVGVTPVSKTLYLDLAGVLTAQSIPLVEKLEGITVGKQLDDGSYALILGADNDFSVTQNDDDVQFDVCTDGLTAQQVGLDRACPAGLSLLPSYLYSFKADGLKYMQPQAVREPRVAMLMALGLAGIGTMRANPRKSK
ncbi:MAG: esterase-like activity of phytase family protein [Burkholderiales bacterium]